MKSLHRIMFFIFTLLITCNLFAYKYAFFTGTFDPIHYGHLNVILSAKKVMDLDRVFVIPNFSPRGKPNASSFFTRLYMVRLAITPYKFIDIPPYSLIAEEMKNHQIGVALDKLIAYYGKGNQYYQIIGLDSFEKLIKYGLLQEAVNRMNIILIKRPGYEFTQKTLNAIKQYPDKIHVIYPLKNLKLSSTRIRNMVKNNQDITGLVPEAVKNYILERHLYRN